MVYAPARSGSRTCRRDGLFGCHGHARMSCAPATCSAPAGDHDTTKVACAPLLQNAVSALERCAMPIAATPAGARVSRRTSRKLSAAAVDSSSARSRSARENVISASRVPMRLCRLLMVGDSAARSACTARSACSALDSAPVLCASCHAISSVTTMSTRAIQRAPKRTRFGLCMSRAILPVPRNLNSVTSITSITSTSTTRDASMESGPANAQRPFEPQLKIAILNHGMRGKDGTGAVSAFYYDAPAGRASGREAQSKQRATSVHASALSQCSLLCGAGAPYE